MFVKGMQKPANSGRKKGVTNRTQFDVREALKKHGQELAAELIRIALHSRNESTKVAALKECFDRILGKASQPIEGQLLFGVSAELQRLLEKHDGSTRSIPERSNGHLIEHDASDAELASDTLEEVMQSD